jgi:PAS domain S-box-containing protein
MIVENEAAHAEAIRSAFEAAGTDVEIQVSGTLREYRESVAAGAPDIALVDLNLPDGRALDVLTSPPEAGPFPILIMTGYGMEQAAVEAMRSGALDYIVKSPEAFADMPSTVARALREWNVLKERKRAEEKWRESESRYRMLVENIPQKIFIKDRHSVYVSCNKNYARDLGIAPEESAGKTDYDFFPKELADKYRADDRRIIETGIEEAIDEKYIQYGKEIWVHTGKAPVRNEQGDVVGVLGIFSDITERKKAEEELRKSEERFRALAETTSEMIWEVGKNGVYTYINQKIKSSLGYDPSEMIGKKTPFDVMTPEDKVRVGEIFRAIAESQKPFANLENWNLHKDGRKVLLETSGVPVFDSQGQYAGYRGIDRDITERKKTEEEKRQVTEKLTILVKKLEDRNYQNIIMGEMREMLQACSTMEEAAPIIGGLMEKLFPDSEGALYIMSPSRSDLESVARWGDFPKDVDDNVFAPDACWALRRGRTYLVENVSVGPLCPHLKHPPSTAYVCLPLIAKSDVLGLLHLRSRQSTQI